MASESRAHEGKKVNQYAWYYRLGFPTIKLMLFGLLYCLPASTLRPKHTNSMDPNTLSVFIVLIIASFSLFYMLQGSNPGYLNEETMKKLRKSDSDQQRLLVEIETEETEQSQEIQYHQDRIRKIEIELARLDKESNVPEKAPAVDPQVHEITPSSTLPFCGICAIEPPLRSHHCRFCDQCVATYDHHCFCIGTCIGEKNHCRFWCFLLVGSIEVVAALSVCHSSFRSALTLYSWFSENALTLTITIIFWVLALVIVPLWGFHTFIMVSNVTTYEIGKGPDELVYLKGINECDLPFSNGVVNNITSFCCIRDGLWTTCVGSTWEPITWKPPARIIRDSENICDNLWENKYYSCC